MNSSSLLGCRRCSALGFSGLGRWDRGWRRIFFGRVNSLIVISTLVLLFSSALRAEPVSQLSPARGADQSRPEIKIGVLLTASGPFADIGEDCRRGVEVARRISLQNDRINGQKIRLVYGDSQGDPKVGVTEFKKLVEQDEVSAVIVIRSSIGMAINSHSLNSQIPLLGAVGHTEFVPKNKFAFQMWPTTKEEGSVLAEHLVALGQKEVALITAQDEWTMSLSAEFREKFQTLGGVLVFDESVLGDTTDFAAVVTKLKAKNPKAIFVNLGLSPGALAIKKIRELGISAPVYSNFWSGDAAAIKAAGAEAMEGVAFPEAVLALPNLNSELSKLPGQKRTSGMTLSCYVSLAMIVRAIELHEEVVGKESLYEALMDLPRVELVDSAIYLEDRRALFPVSIKQIRSGTVIESPEDPTAKQGASEKQ